MILPIDFRSALNGLMEEGIDLEPELYSLNLIGEPKLQDSDSLLRIFL